MKLAPPKKKELSKKHKQRFKELINQFLESESAGAQIGRAALAILALGSILVVGAIVPNIFSAFGRFEKIREKDERRVRDVVYYLRKKKMVEFVKIKNNSTLVKITKNGEAKIREFIFSSLGIEKPKTWDGKWRVVIFDIPENFSSARNALRLKLKSLGFYQLQKSVFVFPYPVEDEILFVSALFGVEQYVDILVADSVLYDKELRKVFKFSKSKH